MNSTSDALDAGLLKYSPGAFIGTGGALETPSQSMGIRHVQPITSPADLAQVPLEERKDGLPCSSPTWPTSWRTTSR